MTSPEKPAEHAILGLLTLADSAGHGYDLARNFGEGQPLGPVLRLEPGMLYHHLKKLERTGWVSSSREPQPARPARQVYQVTDAGRTELERWLREPVAHTREIRLEFLVKLYFARLLDPALAQALIRQQREILDRLAASLSDQAARGADDSMPEDDRDFVHLVLQLRLAQTRAAIDWLERAE